MSCYQGSFTVFYRPFIRKNMSQSVVMHLGQAEAQEFTMAWDALLLHLSATIFLLPSFVTSSFAHSTSARPIYCLALWAPLTPGYWCQFICVTGFFIPDSHMSWPLAFFRTLLSSHILHPALTILLKRWHHICVPPFDLLSSIDSRTLHFMLQYELLFNFSTTESS